MRYVKVNNSLESLLFLFLFLFSLDNTLESLNRIASLMFSFIGLNRIDSQKRKKEKWLKI